MSFDFQPNLKGALLELRPLRAEDYHDLYAVAADPLIWNQHPIKDRYKEEVFNLFFREALEYGAALIAIDLKDGRVIGSSRFHGYDKEQSEIEIGWTFLARSHWGGIYMLFPVIAGSAEPLERGRFRDMLANSRQGRNGAGNVRQAYGV